MRKPGTCRGRRGAAMVEMALSLALFTPLLFAGLRLAYGANQVHELADAVSAAARAGAACASPEEMRRVAASHLPGLKPEAVTVTVDRSVEPARVRISIDQFRVVRLTGSEPLAQAPASTFPYPCE